MASRLLTGLNPKELSQITDGDGVSFTQAMLDYGLDPARLDEVLPEGNPRLPRAHRAGTSAGNMEKTLQS